MDVICPHCQQTIKAPVSKPGQYRSKCKSCGKGYAVRISDQPNVAPVVRKLKVKAPATATVASRVKTPSAGVALDATRVEPTAASSGQRPPRPPIAAKSPVEPPPPAPDQPTVPADDLPEKLGGYRIVDRLGFGAMGAVYRARQVSLDREVALKTILAKWAQEARMIARFTREAYAAAQISHHNVVQIYDLGIEDGTHFFAMEYVQGKTISEIVAESGRLDPEIAVSYILQAARGLQAAHGHGMVHRDVKPANLLVSDDGIVKVADLGLVKIATSADIQPERIPDEPLAAARADITMANMAMGTAAFMAPEQSENAAAVDHRADIYALGCTLYSMLTGQTPFEGTTALEVISKHRSQPIKRPDAVVKHVPTALADIVMRMVAKDPHARHDNMGQVVADLESFLGISAVGTFSPTEEHADTMLKSVTEFNGSASAKLRALVGYGFPLLCLLLGIGGLFLTPWLGLATLGCGTMSVLSYFVLSGARDRTDLFRECRELVARSSWTDRLTWLGGLLVVLAIAWATDMLLIWIFVLAISVGLAIGFHAIFDTRLHQERFDSVKAVEDMLRSMRLRGLAEGELRHFVARYSGDDWEEFYEALFGYAAKLDARRDVERGAIGSKRRRFRRWRDPLFEAITSRRKECQDRDEEDYLQRVQADDLQAQGVAPADAVEQAKEIAAQMVRQAMESRTLAVEQKLTAIDPGIAAEQKRRRIKAMLAEARNSGPDQRRKKKLRPDRLIAPLFGSRMRFLAGCLLLTACLLWVQKNSLFTTERVEQVRAAASELIESGDATQIQDSVKTVEAIETVPLRVPLLGDLFNSFTPGIAGLFLTISAFVSGARMSWFAIPAALITVLGATFGVPGIPAIGGPETTSAAIGLALLIAGFFLVKGDHAYR
jgi:serine/threonine protein kinase